MTPSEIYAVLVGGTLAFGLMCCAAKAILLRAEALLAWIGRSVTLRYPYLLRRRRYIGPITYGSAIWVTGYCLSTATIITLDVRSVELAASRTGQLALVNFVFWFLFSFSTALVDLLGLLFLEPARLIDQTLAIGGATLAATHSIMHVTKGNDLVWHSGNVYGTVGLTCIVILPLLSTLQGPAYEAAQKLRYTLATLAVYSLWRHNHDAPTWAAYVAMTSLLIAILTITSLRLLYHNVPTRNKATLIPYRRIEDAQVDAVRIEVQLARGWEVRAGQYVNLIFPSATTLSFWQAHPFMVCWWREDHCASHGRALGLSVLLLPREGMTKKILRDVTSSRSQSITCWVDGPYGCAQGLERFRTVILLATGIGIAAQIPLIKELLSIAISKTSCTRSIRLLWEVREPCHSEWAREWLDTLLQEDEHLMLKISIHCGNSQGNTLERYGENGRLSVSNSSLQVADCLVEQLWAAKGKTVVTVSAYPAARDEAREVLRQHQDTKLIFSRFQPSD